MIVHTLIWLCLVAAATGEEVIKLVTVTLHNGLNVLEIMHRLVFFFCPTHTKYLHIPWSSPAVGCCSTHWSRCPGPGWARVSPGSSAPPGQCRVILVSSRELLCIAVQCLVATFSHPSDGLSMVVPGSSKAPSCTQQASLENATHIFHHLQYLMLVFQTYLLTGWGMLSTLPSSCRQQCTLAGDRETLLVGWSHQHYPQHGICSLTVIHLI